MTDLNKMDWNQKIQAVLDNPNLLDRMGSADLKRVGRQLVSLVMNVGKRAALAETSSNKMTARILELVGGCVPDWSYVHPEEACRLHEFQAFEVIKDEAAWLVCGLEQQGGLSVAIYEYDVADHGDAHAESKARLMASHLRLTFQPRKVHVPE